MATPEQVRAGLTVVTSAAVADTRAVAAAAESPSGIRAAMFATVPLIVSDYIDGAAELALGWFEEIREAAAPPTRFVPSPLTIVNEDGIASSVAWATSPLYDLEQDLARMTDELLAKATEDSLALLDGIVQKDVASGFWDTMTSNATADPSSTGWARFTQTGACGFCRMLADKGAVYTEATADFAAHTSCHCVVAPSYDPDAPRASVMQYVASSRTRTPAQQAALREYLKENFPD